MGEKKPGAKAGRLGDWVADRLGYTHHSTARTVPSCPVSGSKVLLRPVTQAHDAAGAVATAANINRYMDAVYAQLVRGSDKPDLWVADNNYWMLYKQSMQPMQITESSEMAQAGFQNIMYMGSPVIMDGGFQGYGTYGDANASDYMPDGGVPANTMYALNTRYLHYRPHRDRNFVPIRGDRWSVNQDATVRLTGWAGALTTSNRRFQGVLSA